MKMTNKEIIELIAKEIMDWHKGYYTKEEIGCQCWVDQDNKVAADIHFGYPFNPITNANHFIKILNKMRESNWEIEINSVSEKDKYCPGDWEVTFSRLLYKSRCGDEYDHYHAYDDSLGKAICLAALRTKNLVED